jgi:adenine-specific DNA-methyltransferase
MLERLSFLDAAYWLSTAYADLSANEYRKKLAMYFTPPPIANRLMDDLVKAGAKFDKHTFVDPACGGAAFLALVASRMRDALVKNDVSARAMLRHAETHLSGMELDPTLCALSRHFLRMVYYSEICATGQSPKFHILCTDSLKASRRIKRGYDVVVCNPPFRKLTPKEADHYRPGFADVIQGQPNLYALFISLSIRLAKQDGLVGVVTPTSFLSGQYFRLLRTFLLEKTCVKHIGLISERERVYLDVQQETALTVLCVKPPNHRRLPRAAVSVVQRDGRYSQIGHCSMPNSGSSWPLPRDASDIALLKAASRNRFRLADYGYVPLIGGFVWNRDKRPAYMTLARVPARRRKDVVPLIWSSDVRTDGRLHFDGTDATHGQHRYVDFSESTQQMVRGRPGVILQRVTSVEQPKRLVGAVVSDKFLREHRGYVGENHVVILEQVSPELGFSPKQLLELLETHEVERYFHCISGSSNVSVFELLQLPLPDPFELKRLLGRGMPIKAAAKKLLLSAYTS